MKQLCYILLFLLPALAFGQPVSKVVVIGGPPAVTTNDSVYGSKAGANWDTYLNKNQKTFGAWNPNTGKSVINKLVGADYSNVTKSGQTVTVYDAWPGVDYSVTFNNPGWSESGTITSVDGMTFQVYRATDIANVSVSGDTIFFGAAKTAFISPMIAWDANGDTLTVMQTVASLGVQQGYPTWRFTYAIDTVGVVYPVTFDPNTIISESLGGNFRTDNVTYATARGATQSANTDGAHQWGQETGFSVWRGFITFSLATVPSGGTIDSARIRFYDLSYGRVTANFNWGIIASKTDVLGVVNVEQFPGWDTGTTSYSGIVKYAPFVNTASAADSVIFTLNSVGMDSLLANVLGDGTFSAFVISSEDSASSEPVSNERLQMDSEGITLRVYYHYNDGISAVSALDSNRIIVTYDTTGTGAASGDTLQLTYSSAGDTVKATGFTLIGTDGLTDTVTVLYADSNYAVKARHSHTAGGYYTYLNNGSTVRTRAANTAPLMGGWSQKSIFLKALQGSNRPNTHMALICSTAAFGPRIMKITGDTSKVGVADSGFNKFSTWLAADSIFSKPWFATATKPTVWAIWKNGDSLKTSRSAAKSDSTFGTVTTTAGFLDSTRVTGTTTISAVPSWVTTLLVWLGASSSHADSAVTDTTALTPGTAHLDTASSKVRTITPNSKIALVGTIKLNSRDSLATSSADTIWTDPISAFTFTWLYTSDTSLVPTIGWGGNPPYQQIYILDSALVDAGSTKVYFGPTALSTTPVYYDTLFFTGTSRDTLKIVRNSGLPQLSTSRPRMFWVSGDTLTVDPNR